MPGPESLRDELMRLEAKQRETTDDDIRAALQLRIDGLREQLSNLPDTGETSPAPVKRANLEAQRLALRDEGKAEEVHILWQETVRPPGLPETPPEALREAERLVREARVQKMRGQTSAANELLKKAIDAAPDAPGVIQAVADDYYEARQLGPALEAYRRLKEIDPSNLVAERRIAELSLRSSPGSIEEQLRLLSDGGLIAPEDALASPRAAMLISVFVPGGGQIALGRTWTGGAILVAWGLCVFLLFLMRRDVESLVRVAGGGAGINYVVLIPIFVALMLHLGSIMACASMAKGREARAVERPRPPMDLPFE